MAATAKRFKIETTPLFDPPDDPWSHAEEYIDSPDLFEKPFRQQREAFLANIAAFERGLCSSTYVLPTGVGKTHIAAYTFDYLIKYTDWDILAVAHLGELMTQLQKRLKAFGVDSVIEKAGMKAQEEMDSIQMFRGTRPRVVVGSRQTLVGKRLKSWNRKRFQLIWFDECFPAGTKVDGRNIEDIKVGDRVRSFNHETGEIEARPVVRTFKSQPSALVRVTFSDGREFVCTPGHPFCVATPDGGHRDLAAACLDRTHLVYTEEAPRGSHADIQTDDVRHLSKGVHASKLEHREDPDVLPDVSAGGSRETVLGPSGDGMEASGSRGEREGLDGCPESPRGEGWTADGARGRDRALQGRVGIPAMLQARPGGTIPEVRDRGRREFPQHSPGSGQGQEEGRVLGLARVDRVEVLERSGDGWPGGVCPGDRVHNIEVEGNHNYFVGGALVHNCHHVSSISNMNIIGHFSDAYIMGATATDYRNDNKDIYDVFQERVYEYPLWQAIDEKMVCKPVVRKIPGEVIDLRGIKIEKGDLSASDSAKRIQEHLNPLANAILEQIPDRKIIVFTPSVATAYALADMLSHLGMKARAVDGQTPVEDRARILEEFDRGEFQCLVNMGLFTEGFDAKGVDAIVVLRPTKFRGLLMQMIGRGLRRGKPDCIILDPGWVCDDHKDLANLAELIARPGVRPEAVRLARERMGLEGTDHDPMAELDKAEADLKRIDEERIRAGSRWLDVKGKRKQTEKEFRDYDLLDGSSGKAAFTPIKPRHRAEKHRTERQAQQLATMGVRDPLVNEIGQWQAADLLTKLYDKKKKNTTSYRQYELLKSKGVDAYAAWTMNRDNASELIDTYLKKR